MNSTDIDILPYDPKFSRDFARLNYEWLEKYFIVEDYDAEILLDPQQHIMDPGGEILLAVADGQVVGTTALIVRDADTFELAKMAVTADFQGLRIGQKLMYAAIDYSRRAGKRRIILDSNTKLRPALALYEKVGFREIPYDPNSPYQRCNIRMELML
ncbi:MAG: GNAT family N-acetyltransferase [Flavobacteriales bacterium]|nr:GNAT family N-acetyltransferase [Flavobacteriales bacterium]